MSSDSFRLESFRPWNPFQDKAQPLRNSLDICRYPSPVSITATSPPSNSSNSASTNPNFHFHKPERHPLPPRPPVEACLNDSLPQEINTQHQPAMQDQTLCVNPGVQAFDFEDIRQLQDLPSSGDEDRPMIYDNLGAESQHPLDFESGDPGFACTTSQHSHTGITRSSVLTSECCDATIDPAILGDYHFRDIEQTPARKDTDVVVPSRSSDKTVRGRSMRPKMKPRRQWSKINKVSVVVDNRHVNRTGRSTRANGPVKMSFSILRDQFSSLPVEEQLQFLSWLFQGALSQCLHASSSADGASALGSISGEEETSTPPPAQPFAGANVVDIQHPGSSRKGLPFIPEEDRLLVKLRKEDALTWSEVIKRFSRKFPGRSKGSIQVHWSTTLRKQLLS
ncbi:hypothetical protein DTO013E5_9486 [Penicillium roqueforti]|nr:uncharacterized protein N7487_001648 [Penicillium crustosum]KAI2735145.1 hypothetical protein DTO012A1_9434 [Penicillium roqueforti]KAI2741629.1 hypothetical protein DTO013F2_8760 [Penicillium roqueforti]KAI2764148.1 hypothetical protein DTO012A8_9526 [Penicillium roqueforti]KAI3067541.1 hypothetical protein CBS147339_8496 [Penicillium roqueforti]KAI3090536.1 hypothetical protein CBS147338_8855 [Penicillium roqueforti]